MAARHDGNRAHIEQNINAVKEALAEDMGAVGPNRGALTEALLVVVGELTRIMLEKTAGGDVQQHVLMIIHAWNEWAASIADELVTPEVIGRPGEEPSHLKVGGVVFEIQRADVLRPVDPAVDARPTGELVVKLVAHNVESDQHADINVFVAPWPGDPTRPDWSTFGLGR